MPIFEYLCRECSAEVEKVVAYTDKDGPQPPCAACGGELAWAGLSAPILGREQRFGAILNDGTRVKGSMFQSKRKPRAL